METEAWRATVHGVKKSDVTEATEYVRTLCIYLSIYLFVEFQVNIWLF